MSVGTRTLMTRAPAGDGIASGAPRQSSPPGAEPGAELPLSAASARLRGKPGRPRKPGSPEAPQASALQTSAETAGGARRSRTGAADVPQNVPVSALVPRLLDLPGVARYLQLSPWSARHLVAAGIIPRVRVPAPGGEIRKVLVDKMDLDELVQRWKDCAGG